MKLCFKTFTSNLLSIRSQHIDEQAHHLNDGHARSHSHHKNAIPSHIEFSRACTRVIAALDRLSLTAQNANTRHSTHCTRTNTHRTGSNFFWAGIGACIHACAAYVPNRRQPAPRQMCRVSARAHEFEQKYRHTQSTF